MFLESVREGTMKNASSAEVPEGNRVIPYEIVEIEFGTDKHMEEMSLKEHLKKCMGKIV